MPIFIPLRRFRLSRCFVVLALLTLLSPATLAWQSEGSEKPANKAAAEQQLNQVRSKMQALSKQQALTAGEREKANAELQRRAKALAYAASAVRETDQALAAKQRELDPLTDQRRALNDRLTRQRQAIADLLRASYALGRGTDLRLLLGDQDVQRIARALVYSKYFQADRLEKVRQLMADLTQLTTLEERITGEQQSLKDTRLARAAQAKTLAEQRAAQQKLAAQVNATYQDETERLAELKRNESSLNALMAQLQKAIDEASRQAAKEAARRGRENPGKSGAPAVSGEALADIRGNLPWPASGAVNDYGNGVLIKASGGSDVHAVAKGRVIFANFMRGYGMLLILDHGDGWMSMYGNNEALLRKVGDTVAAGQAVGTATAPTGANTGAYFELRHNNKPVSPGSWLAKHR